MTQISLSAQFIAAGKRLHGFVLCVMKKKFCAKFLQYEHTVHYTMNMSLNGFYFVFACDNLAIMNTYTHTQHTYRNHNAHRSYIKNVIKE